MNLILVDLTHVLSLEAWNLLDQKYGFYVMWLAVTFQVMWVSSSELREEVKK